jgi:integrase
MAVLEPTEVDRHAADSALVAARDPSLDKFDSMLRAQQLKPGSRSTYLWALLRLKRSLDDPNRILAEVTEAELLTAMAKVADKALANGYQTFAISVRRFYSSLGREDLIEKIRIPRRPSKLPEILSEKEIKLLIEKAPGPEGNLRNRLIVELLWETGCRVGELCALRIKDVQFDQYSGIIHLSGKTGERRVRVFASKPDLIDHLNGHPFKNNPNEYLFLSSLGKAGHFHRLTDGGVRVLLATLSRQVLNRRIHPHQLRHTRATELSRYLTDRELKIFGGWKRTQMLEVYSHLSGKDVDDKILALHGIKLKPEDQDFILSVRVCHKEGCGTENSPLAIYCQKCAQPLVADTSEAMLKDPKFIEGLVQNKEFLDALKKALSSAG